MEVLALTDAKPHPRTVALGEFDGVHVGHQKVIAGSDTVLTFEPHPRTVLAPQKPLPLLSCPEAKAERIERLGVSELVIVEFTPEFANLSPMDFIDDLLVGQLHATHVSVGADFHFGHLAAGDVALLSDDERFRTRVVDLVEVDGERVSSTRIRRLVAAGDVQTATRLLGQPFMLSGIVISGDRRGRELGFPTANIAPNPAYACPAPGVYAGFASGHPAAISVGVRPTFGSDLKLLVESYLLDFDGDLYGQRLNVEFIERLRGEERFENVAELVDQMRADVARTRDVLSDFRPSC